MLITALRCKKCNSVVFSRSTHDFRWCSCESCAIDGGFDYTSITGSPEDYELVKVETSKTKKELYDDWNLSKDEFGLIKNAKKGIDYN